MATRVAHYEAQHFRQIPQLEKCRPDVGGNLVEDMFEKDITCSIFAVNTFHQGWLDNGGEVCVIRMVAGARFPTTSTDSVADYHT